MREINPNSNKIHLEEEKIKLLSSPSTLACIRARNSSMQLLIDLDIDKIKALTSWDALDCYETVTTMEELMRFDTKKIEALTSKAAIICYHLGFVNFQDLKSLEVNDINDKTQQAVNSVKEKDRASVQTNQQAQTPTHVEKLNNTHSPSGPSR